MNGAGRAAALAAAALIALGSPLGVGAAYATSGPPTPIGPPPNDGPPGPFGPTQQKNLCQKTQVDSDNTTLPPAQRSLNFQKVWQFSRGQGIRVAVIDTGVARNPGLPNIIGGGDYVSNSDGTQDCDAHGTIVAGIIGAKDTGQGFSGVAPDATIISLRAQSAAYEPQGTVHKDPGEPSQGYGPLGALAAAIRHATDLGANVINISLTACAAANAGMNDDGLGAAAKYAFDHNVVVVAAAGNIQEGECPKGNDNLIDPVNPEKSMWDNVTTISSPSRFSQYVLSVGSVDKNGSPSAFSVPGPWVGIAAPGEEIVSLAPDTAGLTNAKVDAKNGNTVTFQGTSFAAPYVSGIAALTRAKYPQLSAGQVIERLELTARAPGGGWNPYVGYGIVDPIAAVTADVSNLTLPTPDIHGNKIVGANEKQLPVPVAAPPADHRSRNTALAVTGVVALVLILSMLAAMPIRKKMGK